MTTIERHWEAMHAKADRLQALDEEIERHTREIADAQRKLTFHEGQLANLQRTRHFAEQAPPKTFL